MRLPLLLIQLGCIVCVLLHLLWTEEHEVLPRASAFYGGACAPRCAAQLHSTIAAMGCATPASATWCAAPGSYDGRSTAHGAGALELLRATPPGRASLQVSLRTKTLLWKSVVELEQKADE